MAEKLTILDTMFLELEQADDAAHMHIGATLVFEPLPDGGVPDVAELRTLVSERMGVIPRFAERLSSPQTGPLTWLTWERAPTVDFESHIRHATLDAPGDGEVLRQWCAEFWSHRLDRHRPLWEMVLLDGLEGGGWALATKTHHCLVDGVGSLDIGELLLDRTPDAERMPPQPLPPEHEKAGNGRFWLSPRVALRGAQAGLGAARHPREAVHRVRAAADMIIKDEIIGAPSTSLNGPMSGTRNFATVEYALEDVKEIADAHHGTVNDVVLALCAGGLRRLLLARGEPLPSNMRAQVPVNVRTADSAHKLHNELTSLFVELPLDEGNPIARLDAMIAQAEKRKSGTQRVGGRTIVDIADMGPPLAGEILARMMFGTTRVFNLTITNVPGPPEPRYAFGSRMTELLPLVPLFAGHHVGIAIVSYAGRMMFGLNVDRLAVPDLDVLVEGIETSMAELRPAGAPA
jgi:WS/DGAT/MGAT family acyltransferase